MNISRPRRHRPETLATGRGGCGRWVKGGGRLEAQRAAEEECISLSRPQTEYLLWYSYLVSETFEGSAACPFFSSVQVLQGTRPPSRCSDCPSAAHTTAVVSGKGNLDMAKLSEGFLSFLPCLKNSRSVPVPNSGAFRDRWVVSSAMQQRRHRSGHLVRIPRRLPCLGLRERSIYQAATYRPVSVFGSDIRLKGSPRSTRARPLWQRSSTALCVVSIAHWRLAYEDVSIPERRSRTRFTGPVPEVDFPVPPSRSGSVVLVCQVSNATACCQKSMAPLSS